MNDRICGGLRGDVTVRHRSLCVLALSHEADPASERHPNSAERALTRRRAAPRSTMPESGPAFERKELKEVLGKDGLQHLGQLSEFSVGFERVIGIL